MGEERIVAVPPYARLDKKGRYYALKKDMPYFADSPDVRGYVVIGIPSGEPGQMVPDVYYDWYCTQEAVDRKREEEEKRQREEEERARQEAEEEAEREKNLGESYVSLDDLRDRVSCYPVNGYLAERFFDETGLSGILDGVFGEERAMLIRLSAAMLAVYPSHLGWDMLNEYPMNLHMLFSMDAYLLARLWKSITEEEQKAVYRAWTEKVGPGKVSAQRVESRMTLYHDDSSDRMDDWGWFSSRMRPGTHYSRELMIYRDSASHRILAAEKVRGEAMGYDPDRLDAFETVRNSLYPQVRQGSLRFFQPSYLFEMNVAVRKCPVTIWLQPSRYRDRKEIRRRLEELEAAEASGGYRVIRWQGKWEETEGTWVLVENTTWRGAAPWDARQIMQSLKKRLQRMSYPEVCTDPAASYFDIESEDGEFSPFGKNDFTVKALKGAAERIREDYGRSLCFTTGEAPDDAEIVRELWRDEDMHYHHQVYTNHGETCGIAEDYFQLMEGREFVLLLSSMYREWVYDHIGDLFAGDDELEVTPFFRLAAKWACDILPDGKLEYSPMGKRMKTLLARFGASQKDVVEYLKGNIRRKRYFAETYSEW